MSQLLKSVSLLSISFMIGSAAVMRCAAADPGSDSAVIENFHEVSNGVYRGAAPGDDGMNYLALLKVKTDVDLESFRQWVILPEKDLAEKLGIRFVHEPMEALPGFLGDLVDVDDQQMTETLEVVADPANWPVFVHCQQGMDRTGLVIGLYQVLYRKVAPQDAWAEMLKYGYHPAYGALTRYFEQKTGWKAPVQD